MEETKGRIVIGEDDRAHLKRAGKWAQFIAIVQFIFIGVGFFSALAMLATGGSMSTAMAHAGMPAGFFTWYALFLIIMLVLAFFITIYLSRFASRTIRAVEQGNDAVMTEAFYNLGKYFRLQGIVLIVCFSIFVLSLIGAIIFAGAMASAF